MIEQYYNFCHQTLHTSMYTIPLIIVAVVLAVFLAVHLHGMRKYNNVSDKGADMRGAGGAAEAPGRNA